MDGLHRFLFNNEVTSVKWRKTDSRGKAVRRLTDWSNHVILEVLRVLSSKDTGQHVVVGRVQGRPQQLCHGAVYDGVVPVSHRLGAQHLAEQSR